MARSHLRYIVRDAYGYVLQNAKVNVYLPGTTTVFSGSAFDAVSGGSTTTNPFTTNAQGEIEAWFDTPQSVDVQVDDNSDLAYRAVEGSGSVRPFSTFTEKAEILPTPEDLTGHGASYHTNITRQLFLPVLDVVTDGGTIATRGTPPDAARVLTLPDAATNGMSWAFAVPADWASGALTIQIVHAGQTTTSGSVRWTVNTKAIGSGSIVGTGTSVSFTGTAPTTAELVVTEAAQTGETPAAAGHIYRVSVRRIGADGADTYAASTSLIGILVNYTANQ